MSTTATLSTTSTVAMPPFAAVIKSRDVEDPVNLWLHRPLAYGFVKLIHRTRITPNHVTLLALLVGLCSGMALYVGTPQLMVAGGVLLWVSAILDGADGILARAKQLFSDLGRALDGSADMVVALATVPPAFLHIWQRHQDPLHLWLMPLALITAIVHIELYDFYKESYLQRTNPKWSGEPERMANVEARLLRLRAERAHWTAFFATHVYIGLVRAQTKVVPLLNPWGAREHLTYPVSDETIRIYRKHNAAPMRLWSMISLCPHSYTMAICAIADRLDVYLWIRVVAANAIFAAVLVWQRIASRHTHEDLLQAGLAPVAARAVSGLEPAVQASPN